MSLAADAALQKVGADREQVEFFKRENELKAHALSLKEKDLDALLRSRERTILELESHLKTAMGFVTQKEENVRSLEARLAAAENELAESRNRLTRVVAGARRTREARARPAPLKARKRRRSKSPKRRR